jgi:prophage regulatory protein
VKKRYIRISEIASRPGHEGMLPVSAPTIWRWVKLGTFPPPIRLGPQTTAWPVEAIEEFIRQRAQGR